MVRLALLGGVYSVWRLGRWEFPLLLGKFRRLEDGVIVGVEGTYSYDRWNKNTLGSLLMLHVVTCEDRSDWVGVAAVVLSGFLSTCPLLYSSCRDCSFYG